MKKHIRSRHGEDGVEKFMCPLCTKALTTRSNLMKHINHVHTQEEHYRCDKCENVGKSASCLRGHYWRHKHEDGNWKNSIKWLYCKLCPTRVRQEGQLRQHEKKVHSEGREFKGSTPHCNYQTNYILSIKNHMLRHEEDPQKRFPFACTIPGCDFRRRYKEQMASHELQHETSALQLECKLCPDKCFPDRFSLFFHDCIAHNRKCHKCSLCNVSTCSKYTLHEHMRKIHHSKAGHQGMKREVKKVGHLSSFIHRKRIPVVLLERIDVRVPSNG